MAYLGGAVLIILTALACVSIVGRILIPFGLQPVRGDYEWIEMGVGFAIFAFLPWCHLMKGHASVDLLQPVFPGVMNRLLDLAIDIAMLGAAVILTWRLWLGMHDKLRYEETTFILQFPIWQAYAAGVVGCAGFIYVAVFCVLRSARALTGKAGGETANV
jgi:TRAP-type C4-dicarboxylate transport system permease small subunit